MATKSELLDSVTRMLASAMAGKNVAKRKKGYKRAARKHTRISV